MEKILSIDEPKMRRDLIRASQYWAELTGADVKFISVIDESFVRDTTRTIGAVGRISSAVENDFIREREEKIDSVLKETGFEPRKGIDVKAGNPVEEIKKVMDSFTPDLTVMGSGLKAGVINITGEIIGYAKGNCFVNTKSFTTPLFKKIILTTYNPDRDKHAVEVSFNLAERFKGTIYILSVLDLNDEVMVNAPGMVDDAYASTRETLKRMVDAARERGIAVEGLLKEGRVSNVIRNLSIDIKPDIIVLGSYSRTGLNRILMGSVADSLIKKVQCPLLIVKRKLTIKDSPRPVSV